jgi:putative transposase
MSVKLPEPSKAEAIALFRLGVVGDLLARDLPTGDLRAELLDRASRHYRPPDARATRTFHWKTLQAWYYAAKHGGLASLHPSSRKQGFALGLTPDQRTLLIEIRAAHPSSPANLILDVAVREGIIAADQISASTLRRLFQAHGVPRSIADRASRRDRRRWEAAHVGALWHADVAHVWVRDLDGTPRKIYVHGMLDDHSRYVVALEARSSELETDALAVLCTALLRLPSPDVFYVDNGACYRGDVLARSCAKLDIKLVHAKSKDPKARGKMERFWRTMRTRCTDHLGRGATLQDVNAALLAFLDVDYNGRPHEGLMGETPSKRFHAGLEALPRPCTAKEIARALEIAVTRRVAGDGTFSFEGRTFEVQGRHLLHKVIELTTDPFTGTILASSYKGAPIITGLCDPKLNRSRRRAEATDNDTPRPVPFDPIAALLAQARKEKS